MQSTFNDTRNLLKYKGRIRKGMIVFADISYGN